MRISVVASLLSSLALAACGTSSQPQSYIPPLTAYPTGTVAARSSLRCFSSFKFASS